MPGKTSVGVETVSLPLQLLRNAAVLQFFQSKCFDWAQVLTVDLDKDLESGIRPSVLSFLLLALYIAKHGPLSFQVAVDDIYHHLINTPNMDAGQRESWTKGFQNVSIRLLPDSTLGSDDCLVLLRINEELERIRLHNLSRLGFTSTSVFQNPSLASQLSPLLSTSYFTILEFCDCSEGITFMNLEFLARFASALPISWFTVDLLKVLHQRLAKMIDTGSHVHDSALLLLASHSRLDKASPYAGTVGLLERLLLEPCRQDTLVLALSILVGYAEREEKLADTVQKVLQFGTYSVTFEFLKPLARYFATLQGQPFVHLADALFSNESLQDESSALRIMNLMYFVAEYKGKEHFRKHPQSWLNAFRLTEPEVPVYVADLVSLTKTAAVTRNHVFAAFGSLCALKSLQNHGFVCSQRIIRKLETFVSSHISKCPPIQQLYLLGEAFDTFQWKSPLDVTPFVEPSLVCIFDHPLLLAAPPTLFHLIGQITGPTADLDIQQLVLDELKNKGSDFFPHLGKMNQVMAVGIRQYLEASRLDALLELFGRIQRFSAALSLDCDTAFFNFPVATSRGADPANDLALQISKYLKSCLFSVLLLTEPLSQYLREKLLLRLAMDPAHYAHMTRLIEAVLATFSNLHFITSKFGLGAFALFESQQAIFVASLVKISLTDPQHFGDATVQTLATLEQRSVVEPPEGIQDHAKLLFYLLQCLNALDFLGDDYIALRVIRHITGDRLYSVPDQTTPLGLLQHDIRDLSHGLWLKIYQSSTLHQRTIRKHGFDYANNLLLRVNNGIEPDFAAETLKGIVTGLCDFSPSTEHLFLKKRSRHSHRKELDEQGVGRDHQDSAFTADTRSMTQAQKEEWAREAQNIAWSYILLVVRYIDDPSSLSVNIPASGGLQIPQHNLLANGISRISLCTILFAQIPAICLGRLPELLDKVEQILLVGPDSNDASGDRKGLGIVRNMEQSRVWKSLYDAISEPNFIDYSRRHACVLWYLELHKKALRESAKLKSVPRADPGKIHDSVSIKAKL
ncbi:hypothetical protein HDV03_000178 [Kappamyces sp. JEL0829]|nr:hypothetical protein HDV03_000178 [Kappamyces sp. JEL0829]